MSGMRRAPRESCHGSAVVSSPWILVSIGGVAMMVLLVIAAGAYRAPGPGFDPVPPGPPAVAVPIPAERASSAGQAGTEPPPPAMPGLSPRRTDRPSPSSSASRTPEPPAAMPPPHTTAPPPAPPSAPPAAPPPLEARYQVLQTFPNGFIGEVSIRNASRGDLGWVARVEYPGGRVVTAWLEGVPQGTFRDRRGTLTYRSGPDLAAGSTVLLRFHIESAHPRPAGCAVSGRSCAGV